MEVYVKADKTIKQNSVDLMMSHLDKLLSKHTSIEKVKINLKNVGESAVMHRVRSVVKINGHNILCMVVGNDIYDTIANLIEKLERSLVNFYSGHNSSKELIQSSKAA